MDALQQYAATAKMAFGDDGAPIATVARRAERAFDRPVIVWEGDAQTFQFSFVSPAAESILGHPSERWIREASFWADTVVHPQDRDDAIAYCALATGRCRDHAFVYRAKAMDGRVIWLADYVQVVVGRRGIPERLRGIMVDVTGAYATDPASVGRWTSPTREQLDAAQ